MSSYHSLGTLLSTPYRWGQTLFGYSQCEDSQQKKRKISSISSRSPKTPFTLDQSQKNYSKLFDIIFNESVVEFRKSSWEATLIKKNSISKLNSLAVYWDIRGWLSSSDKDFVNLSRTCKSAYNCYLATTKFEEKEKMQLLFAYNFQAFSVALIHDFSTKEARLFHSMIKNASKSYSTSFFEVTPFEDIENLFKVILNSQTSSYLSLHRTHFIKLWIDWEKEASCSGKPSILARAAEKGKFQFLQLLRPYLSNVLKADENLLKHINFLCASPETDSCIALLLKFGAFVNYPNFSDLLRHHYKFSLDCILNFDCIEMDPVVNFMRTICSPKSSKIQLECFSKDFEAASKILEDRQAPILFKLSLEAANYFEGSGHALIHLKLSTLILAILENQSPSEDIFLAENLYLEGINELSIEKLISFMSRSGVTISSAMLHRLEWIQMHIYLNTIHRIILARMDGTYHESVAIKLLFHQVLDSVGHKIPPFLDNLYQGYGFFTFMSYLHLACSEIIQKKELDQIVILKQILRELRFALEIELQWPISDVKLIISEILSRISKLPKENIKDIPGFLNACLVIPGGHIEFEKSMGHALIYVIKRAQNDTFSFQIINTGQGVQKDSAVSSKSSDLIYTNLTQKELSSDFFLELFNFYPLKKVQIDKPKTFYAMIHSHLFKDNNLQRGRPHHIQGMNSCESKRISCFLKERLTNKFTQDTKLYFWIKSLYTEALIIDFKLKMEKMPLAKRKELFGCSDDVSLENFQKQVIKSAEMILNKRLAKASGR